MESGIGLQNRSNMVTSLSITNRRMDHVGATTAAGQTDHLLVLAAVADDSTALKSAQ